MFLEVELSEAFVKRISKRVINIIKEDYPEDEISNIPIREVVIDVLTNSNAFGIEPSPKEIERIYQYVKEHLKEA